MKNTVKTAFLRSLPVMAGYIVLGFGFGIISHNSGYGLLWVLAMSGFIYAGSMQYVSIDLLTSGASLVAAALTTVMVNARHLFYGISMVDKYKDARHGRPYMIFALTDETYSLVCSGQAPDGLDYHSYALVLSIFNHSYWVIGSLLGALVGTVVPWDFDGVEFAMTALFITVFIEQWKSTKQHLPALIGLASSLVCLIIFGSDGFLIPSMTIIGIALLICRGIIDKKEK